MMIRTPQLRGLLSLNTCTVPKRHKSKSSYVTGSVPSFPFINKTVGQVVQDAANAFEDREALVSVHQRIRKSYSQIYSEAFKLATAFSSIGLREGDYLAIWSPNSYEWLLTQCAAALGGLILVNVNPVYQREELIYVLNKIPIKGIICPSSYKTQRYYDILSDAAPELRNSIPGELKSEIFPHLKSIIVHHHLTEDKEGMFPGTYSLQSLVESGGTSKDTTIINSLFDTIQTDSVTNIQFTSGTTGRPKGVELSHFNIVNNASLVTHRLEIGPEYIICCWVPFFHTFGCVGATFSCLLHGAKLILPSPGFDAVDCLKSISEEKCSFLFGTPTMFLAVMDAQKKLRLDVSSVKKGLSGGALFATEVCGEIVKHLGITSFYNIYGATETSPATFCTTPEDAAALKIGTLGPLFPHMEAKIVDREGMILPVNTPGELCVRTPCLMHGYFEDEKATRKVISRDRYYRSGDLALITEEGYCQMIGRMDDMINRGGENVYPKETEDFLARHPNVLENYIFGVPDEKMGETLCAWIRLEDESKEFDVTEYCQGKISHFKIPKYTMFVKVFPKTASGKVKKFEMKAESIKILGLKAQ